MSEKQLHWGILSTGTIAKTFARGLAASQTGKLVGVASRSQESADAFGAQFDVPKCFSSYEKLLDDPEIEAVYIATPHPLHAEWTIRAADAKKHILCEKPLTLNYPDAMRVVEAARRNGVQLMEAFMYRCHPQTARVVELIQSGVLGEVRQIEATFAFDGQHLPESRLMNPELGGGGILDVGCYTTSYCRLIAGAALGKPVAEPLEIKALAKIGATGIDEYTSAVLRFPGDILALCSTGVKLNGGGSVRIVGTQATLSIPSPYFCGPTDGKIKLVLTPHGKEAQEIEIEAPGALYSYEADAMFEAVKQGRVESPIPGPDDALGNMRALDLWRREIGLQYPHETPARLTQSVTQAPLRVHPSAMRYGSLENVTDKAGNLKKISKIVIGSMFEGAVDRLTHGLSLLDDFFERGGTAIDTAKVYGSETIVGHWLRTRGVRDDVTIIVKGAHPPNCSPDGFRRELQMSLENLGIDGGDIYMLHRDNLEVPIGEWVDALNEGIDKGFYRAFGGSNWSIERLEAANQYAKSKGVTGFSCASNNFSLARLVEPVWSGCIASSDSESRAWFEANNFSLFSWSSQARGFFARAARDFTSDKELVRCWYSDDNFSRLERAQELASQKGVSPVVIAAAYVLAQKFPIYALIGPANLGETRDSMRAFEVELSEEEVRWLNLEV
jgi:predicted dehydrogenase/aryl-alcohol dehydrogenase-like predicted oxidoreductase